MSNQSSSNEPIFETSPEEDGNSGTGSGNILTGNTTDHRRAIMFVAALLYGIFARAVLYNISITFREVIFPAIVGLAVFELLFRTRRRLSLKTLPVYIVVVTFLGQILYSLLYQFSYPGGIWNPLVSLTFLFTELPYGLYFLIESSVVTGLAYYLIKMYRKDDWETRDVALPPADSNGPTSPESVTDLLSFVRRYKQQLWGFFGWFVIASLIAPFSFGLITTPLTVVYLIKYGLSKDKKGVAGGLLVAVSINFVVSLMRNMQFNATCFIPFYFDVF